VVLALMFVLLVQSFPANNNYSCKKLKEAVSSQYDTALFFTNIIANFISNPGNFISTPGNFISKGWNFYYQGMEINFLGICVCASAPLIRRLRVIRVRVI
jgi:hypothetical protein